MTVTGPTSVLVLGFWTVLTACTINPIQPAGPAADAIFSKPRWNSFSATGRIAAHKGDDAMSGSFRWDHTPDGDQLDFASPLGQSIARLVRNAQGVSYRGANGRQTQASDWESLTAKELGWSLPVDGLAYWVQGTPSPGAPFTEGVDAQRRPSELKQQGWTIKYQAYDAQNLPIRVRLSTDEVDIRLAIDTWQPNEPVSNP